jgi:hypothetical protein
VDNFKDNDPNAPELIEAPAVPKGWDKVDTSVEPDYKVAERELTEKLAANDITVEVKFVPRSKSPNPKAEQVNWEYTLKRGGKAILSGPFMQGIGHIKGWKMNWSGRKSMLDEEILTAVLETGGATHLTTSDTILPRNPRSNLRPRIRVEEPSPASIVSCLCLDASAIDCPDYESFADELGYEKDSRSGEKIYRECLAIGLKLRAALGDSVLTELRELSSRL